MIPLADHQLKALRKLHNGCVLRGAVGTGKSRTALAWYYIGEGGDIFSEKFVQLRSPTPLYIITTARKRDTLDWEAECIPFRIDGITVDSWNNIGKYKDVKDCVFIFDEQRTTSGKKWAKTFIRIARNNRWIMLSATPGDKWWDYRALFVANGFYRNFTDFDIQHCVFSRFTGGYHKVTGYRNVGILMMHRNDILVRMDLKRSVRYIHDTFDTTYDPLLYRTIAKKRWNPWKDAPIVNASELCQCLRKVTNTDISRANAVLTILEYHEKAIIFYNYDYELDILRSLAYGPDTVVAEWNGHKHEPVPECEQWVYLVQYTAGSEGWNCVSCDTIIFYSQNYSYRTMVQAAGRIDRLNSPYETLYYFHIKSDAPIDKAISRALKEKKEFNEKEFFEKLPPYQPEIPMVRPIEPLKWEDFTLDLKTGMLTSKFAKNATSIMKERGE